MRCKCNTCDDFAEVIRQGEFVPCPDCSKERFPTVIVAVLVATMAASLLFVFLLHKAVLENGGTHAGI